MRGEPPLLLGRDEAHGAVLVDELVTRGVDEPFRMLTGRSEHRLRLREGNADLRLAHHGHRVGLVPREALERVEARGRAVAEEVARLGRTGGAARLKRPEVTYAQLVAQGQGRAELPGHVQEEVEVEVKYAGYVAQAARAAAREREVWDAWSIPEGFAFDGVPGLSREAADKLRAYRPATVGHARRIPGLTPAALSLLLGALRRSFPAPSGSESPSPSGRGSG